MSSDQSDATNTSHTEIDPSFGVAVTTLPTAPLSGFVVVVGADFDVTGDQALAEALKLADTRGDVHIHVAHVLSDHLGSRREAIIAKRTVELEDVPQKLRLHVQKRFGPLLETAAKKVVMHVRVGRPAEALSQLAVDLDAELIIVGTHGRRGLEKFVLGSVAQDLLQIAHCPVLIARPKDFRGLSKTPKPEPLCDDCAKARADSDGETLWCAWHARPHIRAHVYGYEEQYYSPGHTTTLVP
jgi:nucleotide-binding universal stress UspA family protein